MPEENDQDSEQSEQEEQARAQQERAANLNASVQQQRVTAARAAQVKAQQEQTEQIDAVTRKLKNVPLFGIIIRVGGILAMALGVQMATVIIIYFIAISAMSVIFPIPIVGVLLAILPAFAVTPILYVFLNKKIRRILESARPGDAAKPSSNT